MAVVRHHTNSSGTYDPTGSGVPDLVESDNATDSESERSRTNLTQTLISV